MPSKSKKQHNLMELIAHNPSASRRLGIPQSVGEDFVHADQRKKAEARRVKRATRVAFKKS